MNRLTFVLFVFSILTAAHAQIGTNQKFADILNLLLRESAEADRAIEISTAIASRYEMEEGAEERKQLSNLVINHLSGDLGTNYETILAVSSKLQPKVGEPTAIRIMELEVSARHTRAGENSKELLVNRNIELYVKCLAYADELRNREGFDEASDLNGLRGGLGPKDFSSEEEFRTRQSDIRETRIEWIRLSAIVRAVRFRVSRLEKEKDVSELLRDAAARAGVETAQDFFPVN
ncbi:hypothetical protein [Synoicihabitans lomoniglobus]|uniref:Uncharacterized protein n=1 Tax=Synoicihabitans lomoniglobus TaxID=2909285 RepID=A0AAE9ZZN0_9BACT|nr:hypothetical protein [Opitutaceae bacterium LMO-M01]WED64378.1 hypothetical protein PXH66_18725 [Opitutaceae bacterium LMO-M01]